MKGLLWASACCGLAATTVLADYPPATVTMELQRVSEHVYYVQGPAGIATDNEGFISNATAIIADDGIVIVDALGSPSLAQMFMQKVRAVSDTPVRKVIVTHYHADHFYGLQFFKDMGAEVYSGEGALEYLASDVAQTRIKERRESLKPWVNEQTRLVKPDHVIKSNTRLSQGNLDLEIEIIGAAHSHGDLIVYIPQDGVLLAGDLIFEGRVPFIGGGDTSLWISTLETLSKRDVKAVIPGHGPAAQNAAKAVHLTHSYLSLMRTSMLAAVAEMQTFDEAYGQVDWNAFKDLPAFDRANRINAYRVFIYLEGESLRGN